ncbi:hypothetical protein, partial [Mycobacteroides abscessus]|uniref:hypothetical protein n=1 Tax=Mycobacteroides abscessus TaxID=36809 RepID=UPI0019514C39
SIVPSSPTSGYRTLKPAGLLHGEHAMSPDLESLAVDSAEVLEGGTEIGSATVTADIGIEVVLPTTDYGELRDWRWYLIDGDYNEYSVLVGADFTCALSFSYTADRGIVRTLELTSMRIAAS